MTRNQLLELFPLGEPIRDHRRCNPIAAIVTSALTGAGNLVGGILGKGTANKAGEIQQQAANQARSDVLEASNKFIPIVGQEAGTAGANAVGTAQDASTAITQAARQAGAGAVTAAQTAGTGATEAAGAANKILGPYAAGGATAQSTLDAGLVPGGDFNKTPTLADLQMDPGYAFRQAEGAKALQASAAARGGAIGGGIQKALAKYVGQEASQEYQNAFNRYQASTQNRFGNLNAVAGRGAVVGTTQGGNLIGAAQYGGTKGTEAAQFQGATQTEAEKVAGALSENAAQYSGTTSTEAAKFQTDTAMRAADSAGNFLTQGANAKAAGMVGGANALSAGISGAGSSVMSGLTLASLLKNPAALNRFALK